MGSTYWQHVSRSEVQNKFRRQQVINSSRVVFKINEAIFRFGYVRK